MITKETYHLLLWMGGDNRVNMKEITIFEWGSLDFEEGYTQSFRGERANVFTFTKDTEIDREKALKCATDFMDGNYVTIAVNLDKCTSERITGKKH